MQRGPLYGETRQTTIDFFFCTSPKETSRVTSASDIRLRCATVSLLASSAHFTQNVKLDACILSFTQRVETVPFIESLLILDHDDQSYFIAKPEWAFFQAFG